MTMWVRLTPRSLLCLVIVLMACVTGPTSRAYAYLNDMTAQMTAVMLKQAEMIGRFFDGRTAIDAQRSLQEQMALTARDYTPSEAVCRFGTGVMGLAALDHQSSVTASVLADMGQARELFRTQPRTRLEEIEQRSAMVRTKFCNRQDGNADYATANLFLCDPGDHSATMDHDINVTRTLDGNKTLSGVNPLDTTMTDRERGVHAFLMNMLAHERINMDKLVTQETRLATSQRAPSEDNVATAHMQFRSLLALRSIPRNSWATLIAERAEGTPESAAFAHAILQELGFGSDDAKQELGENPSYHAMMEVLTKKIYQNPNFYVNLMDKPANVKRQQAAMQAISLMQDRDTQRALHRREMLLSALVETRLRLEHTNEIAKNIRAGDPGFETNATP